jgi:hypothetical protein
MSCTRLDAAVVCAVLLVTSVACALQAAVTPQLGLSRTTGVAPLAVFVDATTTAGLDGGDYVNANFAWNFDRDGVDPTGKYTVTRGFVAAHVYENPGTYTVELAVHDRLGATATATAQVVVSAFSGTTYYVATGGSNAAAGTSMTAPLATPDYAFQQKGGLNTRILLRRGDRFTVPAISIDNKAGPAIVGSYTDPNRPSTELPILFCENDGWGMFNVGGTTSDWRFMEIHLRATTDNRDAVPSQGGVGTGSSTANLLFLRMEVDSVSRGAMNCGATQYSFVFDCYCHDYGAYMTYASTVNRLAIVGNVSRRKGVNTAMTGSPEHLIRFQGGSKAFIAYNDAAEGRSNYDEITMRGSTSQSYILQNRFDQMLTIQPQNSTSAEYQTYCVADGNLLRSGGIIVTAKHVAVRNNLLHNNGISLSSHPLVGMSDDVTILNNSLYGYVNDMASGSATNVVIKNNILYASRADQWASGLSFSNSLSNYQIDNNIYYAPNKDGYLWFSNGGTDWGRTAGFSGWQSTGSDVHGRYADPLFVSVDTASPDYLKLSASSPARGAGAVAAVFCDVAGTSRPAGQPTDAGAWLYGTAGLRGAGRMPTRSGAALVGTTAYDLLGRLVRASDHRSVHGIAIQLIQGSRQCAAQKEVFWRASP